MRPRARIPVAVVGAGRVARAVHVPLILNRPDLFDLVAVIETDHQATASFAREYPWLTVATGLDTAFGKGARALVCATPWPTHREIILTALRRGAHVLTEKPASLDPADITELLEAEQRSSGVVAVGYMKRHDPAAVRFIDAVAARLDRLRRICVDVVDPDSPAQVAHRLVTSIEPSAATRAASARAVRGLFGRECSDEQRTVYQRGLGGSLIHHINLVHTALSASPYRLLGRIRQSTHWADGSAVSCGWWPAEAFGVQMTHVRSPLAPRYRERIEVIAEDCRLALHAPSPYLLEQAMSFTEEHCGRIAEFTAPAQGNGFVRQLECWAASIHAGGPALPGLAEAQRDLAVVREAALACTGPPEALAGTSA